MLGSFPEQQVYCRLLLFICDPLSPWERVRVRALATKPNYLFLDNSALQSREREKSRVMVQLSPHPRPFSQRENGANTRNRCPSLSLTCPSSYDRVWRSGSIQDPLAGV